MEETKHIIFDLDGTIIDSKIEIISTYQHVLDQIPTEFNVDLNAIDFGANLNQVLSFIYKSDLEKIVKAKDLFANLYDNSNFENTFVYEKVHETLTKLLENGKSLYVATNKRHIPSRKIIEIKQLKPYFKDVIGNEMSPNVSMSKSKMIEYLMNKHSFKRGFMIGDTVGDIDAGKANGLSTIAVSYGYQSLEELEKENPNYMSNSFENLLKFILT